MSGELEENPILHPPTRTGSAIFRSGSSSSVNSTVSNLSSGGDSLTRLDIKDDVIMSHSKFSFSENHSRRKSEK